MIASTGHELAAFGDDQQILRALTSLGPTLDGTISLHPETDSWALGLLYDALVRALSRGRPLIPRLRSAGHSILVAAPNPAEAPERSAEHSRRLAQLQQAYDSSLTGTVPKLGYPYAEAVEIRLDRFEDRWWCGFEPHTSVDVPRDAEHVDDSNELSGRHFKRGDPAGDWRRERWAQRYNGRWSEIIDAWAKLLTVSDQSDHSALWVPADKGIDAVFTFSHVTGWSSPAHHHDYFLRTQ